MSNFIADDGADVAFHQKTYTDGFFKIDGAHGFLPSRDPDATVPKEYEALQAVVDKMSTMVAGKNNIQNEIEISVLEIPNFSEQVSAETDIFRLQALYRALTFVTSAYCLEPVQREFVVSGNHGKARNVIPVNIAKPLSIVAEKIGAFPWLDYYYAYTIGNYVRKDPKGDLHWKNQDMAVKFCGSSDEIGFNATHVYINEVTPALVDCVFKVAQGEEVKHHLKRCGDIVKEINVRRKDMWQASASTHFNDFRNFLMGVTGNEALFGEGVVFDTCYNQEPQQFRGASGAQDSIIPMLDIFTGIVDFYPSNELTKYLMDLRVYRPHCLQNFLMDLRTYYDKNPLFSTLSLNERWEEMVYFLRVIDEIYTFRNGHWQFVQKYIMMNTKHDRGTGGTPVTSWLMNQIKSVLDFYQVILLELARHVDALADPDVIAVYEALEKGYAHKVRLLNLQTDLLKGGLANVDMVKMNRSNSLNDDEAEGLRMLQCPVGRGGAAAASTTAGGSEKSDASGCPYHHPRTETI